VLLHFCILFRVLHVFVPRMRPDCGYLMPQSGISPSSALAERCSAAWPEDCAAETISASACAAELFSVARYVCVPNICVRAPFSVFFRQTATRTRHATLFRSHICVVRLRMYVLCVYDYFE
jgi:hypothetical protein